MPNIPPPVRQYTINLSGPGRRVFKGGQDFGPGRPRGGRRRPINRNSQHMRNYYANQAMGPNDLIASYQQALNQANMMNEARYNQLLGGYKSLHERALGRLDNVGQQQSADISERYGDLAARQQNYLTQRGFGNSSLMGTMQMGMTREENKDQRRLAEELAGQRNAVDAAIAQGQFGVIERRNDVGPNPMDLYNIYNQLGRGGVNQQAYGGGGGGYQNVGMLPPNISFMNPYGSMMGGGLGMAQTAMMNNARQHQQLRNSAMRRAQKRRSFPGFGKSVSYSGGRPVTSKKNQTSQQNIRRHEDSILFGGDSPGYTISSAQYPAPYLGDQNLNPAQQSQAFNNYFKQFQNPRVKRQIRNNPALKGAMQRILWQQMFGTQMPQ